MDGEDQSYIMNKAESELIKPEKVFNCLTQYFGSGIGNSQIRMTFAVRNEGEYEDLMTFLNDLESLRTKGFPDEDVTTRRYEILEKL